MLGQTSHSNGHEYLQIAGQKSKETQ